MLYCFGLIVSPGLAVNIAIPQLTFIFFTCSVRNLMIFYKSVSSGACMVLVLVIIAILARSGPGFYPQIYSSCV